MPVSMGTLGAPNLFGDLSNLDQRLRGVELSGGGTATRVLDNGGLMSEFYDNLTLNGNVIERSVKTSLDFNNYIPEGSGTTVPPYSCRLVGWILPLYTDTYTIYATTDDGVRIYINNNLVVDNWQDQTATESSGTAELVADTWVPVSIEHYTNGGLEKLLIEWESTDQGRSQIPSGQMAWTSGGSPTTAGSIAPGSVGTTTIQADSIVSEHIQANTIQTAHLYADAVTADKISANAIQTYHLDAQVVTADKIAANTITAGQIAANTITAGQIAAGTITATEIAAGTITATNIAAGTITGSLIAAGTITATNIAAATITGSLIAATTITATNIAASTITATQIAAATITGGNIAAGTITGSNIAGSTVTASNITISQLSALTADLGTITAGTITGATVQTATGTGARVKLSTIGLEGYDATNARTFFFDTSTGNLTLKGTISTGSTVPTSTLSGIIPSVNIDPTSLSGINLPGINWLLNSSFEDTTDTTNYAATGAVFAYTTAQARYATHSAQLTMSGTGGGDLHSAISIAVTPSNPHTASAYFRPNTTTRNVQIDIEWRTAADAVISTTTGTAVAETASVWTRAVTTGTAPATAAKARIYFKINASAAAEVHYIDGIQLEEGSVVSGYAPNTAEIQPNSIGTTHLIDGSITGTDIAAGTITAANIQALTITASEIAASTITGAKIAANTITASLIAANTITAAEIAANTITASQIAANTITAGQIAAATITTTQIAANTIVGGNIAATTIAASNIVSGTITSTQIAATTITASNIASATITTTQIAAATITAGNIAAGTITGANIAAGTLTADLIKVGTLSTNMVDNGGFESFNAGTNVPDGWYIMTGTPTYVSSTDDSSEGARSLKLGSGVSSTSRVGSKSFPVMAGNTYIFRARVRHSNGNGTWSLVINEKTAAPTNGLYIIDTDRSSNTAVVNAQNTSTLSTTTGVWTVQDITYTVPAGVKYITVSFTNASTGYLYVDDTQYFDRITTTAITPGAITTNLIAAGAITADVISSGAIDGMVITGATIRTAASGARVVIDSTGFSAYDANGITVNIPTNGTASSFNGSVTTSGGLNLPVVSNDGSIAVSNKASFKLSDDTEVGYLGGGATGSISYLNSVLVIPSVNHYWRLGETSGTSLTDSTLSGQIALTISGTYTLNQTSLLINTTNPSILFTNAKAASASTIVVGGTYEAWIKPTTVDGTLRRIFEHGDTTNGVALYHSSAGVVVSAYGNGGTLTSTYSTPFTANNTYHVVAQATNVNSASADIYTGTGANNTSSGSIAWTNPTNITSLNSTVASASWDLNITGATNYLSATNFGFTIPTSATIQGITVKVNGRTVTTSQGDSATLSSSNRFYLIKNGTVLTSTFKGWNVPSAFAWTTLGSASDLWFQSFTATDINSSTFGVAFQSTVTSNTNYQRSVEVDAITISVAYTIGSTQLYVNGTSMTLTNSGNALITGTSSTLAVGQQNAGTNPFIGYIDEFAHYTGLVSSGSISANYSTGNTLAGYVGAILARAVSSTNGDKDVTIIDGNGGSSFGTLQSALPSSPFDGQVIDYVADSTNGVVWRFRYRSASASALKWECIGGSSLTSITATTPDTPTETTSSTSYVTLTTAGPSVTVPFAGEYEVYQFFRVFTTSAGAQARMSYQINATTASDNDGVYGVLATAGTDIQNFHRVTKRTFAAGDVLAARYRTSAGTLSVRGDRILSLRPIRIG
jgi:hypothetical protein